MHSYAVLYIEVFWSTYKRSVSANVLLVALNLSPCWALENLFYISNLCTTSILFFYEVQNFSFYVHLKLFLVYRNVYVTETYSDVFSSFHSFCWGLLLFGT
jgi:hypothetical protein